MGLLTDREREVFKQIESGSYYGQIGITIRFNNHFWHEVTGTLVTGCGDNTPTIIEFKKPKNVLRGTTISNEAVPEGGGGDNVL